MWSRLVPLSGLGFEVWGFQKTPVPLGLQVPPYVCVCTCVHVLVDVCVFVCGCVHVCVCVGRCWCAHVCVCVGR